MKIHCLYDELAPVGSLKPHPKNRNQHPKEQLERLGKILEYQGWRYAVKVSKLSGFITSGHGRLEAAKLKGWEQVPVVYQEYEDEAQEYADVQADNAIASWAELDLAGINFDLEGLGPEFDLDLLGIEGFEVDVAERYDGEVQSGALANRFVVPPFSVLDSRQGYWQERKDWWLKKTGSLTETKENVLDKEGGLVSTIHQGSSNFDPVLAEIMYLWFGLPGGSVLDPFAGEQTKGVVAGEMGQSYTAVDIRLDQVDLNKRATERYPQVQYYCGDSTHIAEVVPPGPYDFVFTSPPYYDLEAYSKTDLSALGTYADFMAAYERIFTQCVQLLGENRFLAVKIGEIRDKKTHAFRNFVGDNISLFLKLGLTYYNEYSLISPAGTAQLRANRYMRTRKAVKLHQNVLVFFKGDVKKIKDLYPNLGEQAEDEGDAEGDSELGSEASEGQSYIPAPPLAGT